MATRSMDSLKARVLDVGLETGELHSPLSGMFSNISRVPSLQEALSPLENQLPRLPSHLKLAQLFLKTLRRKKQQYAQMPDDYCLVLNLYCMEDQPREDSTYYKMNAALRLKNREKVRQWRDFIWLLLHAMQWLSPSDIKFVYRGVMKNLSELGEGYEVGVDVQWAGFSSTATKVEVMNSFLGQDGPRTLMNVELDSQWGRDLRDFSLLPSEEEILLPPNMMFEVTSVLDAGHGLTILQLKQVESPDILLQFEEHPHQTNQPAEPTEKRDILKRKAEEEERVRRDKEAEEQRRAEFARLEQESLIKEKAEKEKEEQVRKTAIAQKAEQAKRLAEIEAVRQEQLEHKRNVIRGQIANKDRECDKLRERISNAERRGIVHGTGGTAHLQNLLRVRIDKRNVLKQKLENV